MQQSEPNYLREWFFSGGNLMTVLSGVAAATVLSFPLGLAGFIAPMVLLAGGEAIASMFVPASATFRNKVNRRLQRDEIEQRREHLLRELGARGEMAEHLNDRYQRMMARSERLFHIAKDRHSRFSYEDALRVSKSSVDFLALCLADGIITDRVKIGTRDDPQKRLDKITEDLAELSQHDTRRVHLKMAERDYQELLLRHQRMIAKRVSIEAALITLPDQIEEIFQMVVASPYSTGLAPKLSESLSRLQLEEDIEMELSEGFSSVSFQTFNNASISAAKKQSSGH